MTLSDLVPSLDTCRALAAAGFPQDGPLAWRFGYHDTPPSVWQRDDFLIPTAALDPAHAVAAPALEEILAVLPRRVDAHGDTYSLAFTLSQMAGEEIEMAYAAETGTELLGPWAMDLNAEQAALLYLSLHTAGLLPSPPPLPTAGEVVG